MLKEFRINDILSAVDSISKTSNKKVKIPIKKDYTNKEDTLILNKLAESSKSDVLVLDQMIE